MVIVDTLEMQTEVSETLDFIDGLNIPFHLTGSRYFGHETKESDWDFFTPSFLSTQQLLLEAGFVEDSSISYKDPFFCKVLKKDNVHVQLVNNISLRQHVQRIIKTNIPSFGSLSKQTRKEIWSALLHRR